jgi:predicted acyltransferase
MNNRAFSLDALRGYAIVTMILSGTIASGVLPGWMYHAQVPPPLGVFDPTVRGITWVDLVFPFFLFAMGAAFPLALGGRYERGTSKPKLVGDSVLRGARLTFFAIFIQHFYPWVTSSPQDTRAWLLAIGAFAALFPMFLRIPRPLPRWGRVAVESAGYAIGATMLLTTGFAGGRTFDPGFSNIIILVLANMAIFGSLVYVFTIGNRWARLAVLPFVMAVFLGGSIDGSWVKSVFDFSPVPWMYRFYYLKYLFIVIPGSIAGEYLRDWLAGRTDKAQGDSRGGRTLFVLGVSVGIVVLNLWGLYTRHLLFDLFGTAALLAVLRWLLRGGGNDVKYWRRLLTAGAYLLMLGLFFEAYEGGIRKDHSTYSYYFVTAGLAFVAMIVFSVICDVYRWKPLARPLEMVGQNPMIAYVAPQLLVMPVLNLTGLATYLNMLNAGAWSGFLRGIIVTALAMLVAVFFTKIKWFWRT